MLWIIYSDLLPADGLSTPIVTREGESDNIARKGELFIAEKKNVAVMGETLVSYSADICATEKPIADRNKIN